MGLVVRIGSRVRSEILPPVNHPLAFPGNFLGCEKREREREKSLINPSAKVGKGGRNDRRS